MTTGKGTLIGVRLLDEPLASLDAWIAKHKEPELSRPEAIRRLVELGLTMKIKGRRSNEGQKLRAREMAAKAIDSITDDNADPDEQASRKRRLLKGPEEFREARVDRPKKK